MPGAGFAIPARHALHHSDQNRSSVEPLSRDFLARDGGTLLAKMPRSAALVTGPRAQSGRRRSLTTRRNCYLPSHSRTATLAQRSLSRLLPQCLSRMSRGSRTISRAAGRGERDGNGGVPPVHRGRHDLESAAGVARHQTRVHDDLAQLSERKMADNGDERTASTIYALGQMS
jgi:hypothetical protein